MALPSINVLMSRVAGSVYFCKIFFVNAFVTNFFPTSTAEPFPASKAFFTPSLATLLPTSRAEDAICLAALLVKKVCYGIKDTRTTVCIPFFKSMFTDYHLFK